jgi:3-dehydroquinate synthase
MKTVPVALTAAPYEVKIGRQLLGNMGAEARSLFPHGKACAVVTDSNVGPLYAAQVTTSLEAAGFQPVLITVPAGEPSKSFPCVEEIVRTMIRAGLDRKGFLIALGGGVVCDLAGFAAAIHFRGIPYIQVPTTVLAQVDSSVGGKTGINAAEGKNLIGAFHQPRLVLADVDTLDTLPQRAWNEGFAEIIKHAAIRDASMMAAISAVRQGTGDLVALIARNVAIKGGIVEADEFETKDLRALLNFGHTIGHAIEACAGYGELLHGEAIALGMRAALDLSITKAGLSTAAAAHVQALIHDFHLPSLLPPAIATDDVLEKLSRDKKFSQGAIRFILLRTVGDAFVSKDVTLAEIRTATEALRQPVR